ncbi:MAG: PD-(D/E)XK nuclease family protein, partial [Zetaproteobacteria bacterium]
MEERMRIRFGMGLDGGAWPEFDCGQDARLGEVIVGPAGLIGLLETHLGLGGPETAAALRIRQYMVRMQSLSASRRFYTDSFAFDAWASARELLAWRDELVLYGWSPEFPDPPERFAALAEIERARDLPLAPGLADRFRAVLAALQAQPVLPIRTICL